VHHKVYSIGESQLTLNHVGMRLHRRVESLKVHQMHTNDIGRCQKQLTLNHVGMRLHRWVESLKVHQGLITNLISWYF